MSLEVDNDEEFVDSIRAKGIALPPRANLIRAKDEYKLLMEVPPCSECTFKLN